MAMASLGGHARAAQPDLDSCSPLRAIVGAMRLLARATRDADDDLFHALRAGGPLDDAEHHLWRVVPLVPAADLSDAFAKSVLLRVAIANEYGTTVEALAHSLARDLRRLGGRLPPLHEMGRC